MLLILLFAPFDALENIDICSFEYIPYFRHKICNQCVVHYILLLVSVVSYCPFIRYLNITFYLFSSFFFSVFTKVLKVLNLCIRRINIIFHHINCALHSFVIFFVCSFFDRNKSLSIESHKCRKEN